MINKDSELKVKKAPYNTQDQIIYHFFAKNGRKRAPCIFSPFRMQNLP